MYKIFKKSGFLNFKTIPIIIYKNQLENIKRKKNFKWHFTLVEEGDYETGIIKYHQHYYDIDKSISVLGEEENEK